MRVLVVILLWLVTTPAFAEDIGALAPDIRHSERMIFAALKTGDSVELRAQHAKLMRLMPRLANAAGPARARIACTMAAQTLANAVSNLTDHAPARALVAFEAATREFARYMFACETRVR